jgi:arylformamidase
MQIYDITLNITPTLPIWPGDPAIQVERISKMEEGANANVTRMNMGVHIGTHVDAPFHFLGGNAPTVEQMPLNVLIGRVYVLHIPDKVDVINATLLQQSAIPPRTRRLIFKTRNSAYWARGETTFQTDFVALDESGAQYLVAKGIKLVGIDYLSIAPFHDSTPTHRTLLGAGVVILEGLDLTQVSPGRYSLYCLPMKLAGSDGAPARAILIGA